MNYPMVPLGEVCKVNPRAGRLRLPDDMLVSFVPMAAVDESLGAITGCEDRPVAEVSKGYTAFADGDVLFAKITPCMENGKTALARNLTNGMGRGSTEFYVLRPGNDVLGEYVYHVVREAWFRDEAKRNFAGTAGQQRVPKSFMENVLIPLPPLNEQCRIVGILNRAAKIERLRSQAQERSREFTPALFVRMFGDPVENSRGWPVASLGEACTIVGGGTPRRSNSDYFGGDIPWVTPTDVTALDGMSIHETAETITERGLIESSARLVPAGTVLLTSRATIGFTAIAAREMATNQGFANLTCGTYLLPEYLAVWLRLQRDRLIHLAGGSTFKEISKSTLKRLEVPLPEWRRQERFVELVQMTHAMVSKASNCSASSTMLGATLMSNLLVDGR